MCQSHFVRSVSPVVSFEALAQGTRFPGRTETERGWIGLDPRWLVSIYAGFVVSSHFIQFFQLLLHSACTEIQDHTADGESVQVPKKTVEVKASMHCSCPSQSCFDWNSFYFVVCHTESSMQRAFSECLGCHPYIMGFLQGTSKGVKTIFLHSGFK